MIEKLNYYLGITVSSWLLTIMVIAAELYSPFKDLLKSVFTHHWVGKIAIMITVFLIVSFLFKDKKVSDKTAFYSVICSLIVILGFFVFEFLKG